MEWKFLQENYKFFYLKLYIKTILTLMVLADISIQIHFYLQVQ